MGENTFTVLLLSDAHIGDPSKTLDSEVVFAPLFQDIKAQFSSDNCLPSLIVFCGDLAYHGEIKDYEEARKYLENIFACFNKTYGEIPILIVPGNHDINRTQVDEAQKEYRKGLDESKVTEMMQNRNVTWIRMIERQTNWRNFVREIPNQPWKWDDTTNLCTGLLSFAGKKIGIAGLNSSWASHEQKEQGELWIGQL